MRKWKKKLWSLHGPVGSFSNYVLGSKFVIETDHKLFIPLLNSKHLDVLPPRIVRFRLRLAKFDYHVCHIRGKLLFTPDTLSQAPVPETRDGLLVESFVVGVTPATPARLEEYEKGAGGRSGL